MKTCYIFYENKFVIRQQFVIFNTISAFIATSQDYQRKNCKNGKRSKSQRVKWIFQRIGV